MAGIPHHALERYSSELIKKNHSIVICDQIEKTLGRNRMEKWGQRTIDIDIISYENMVIETSVLTVPHPYLNQRNFVLHPLAEIYPDWIHPITKKNAFELKLECKDKLKVIKL